MVLINGRPPAIPELAERVPAILEGWYLGQEGGTAVAEVLFGDVNPGGRLPVSFPRSVGQLPLFYNHKPTALRGYLFESNTPLSRSATASRTPRSRIRLRPSHRRRSRRTDAPRHRSR